MSRYLFLIVIILSGGFCRAQETNLEEQKSLAISAVPQQILNNAVRFEIDFRRAGHNWITLAPEFYFRDEDFEDAFDHPEYNTLVGAGIEVFFRKYIQPSSHGEGFYIAYGGGYRFLKINTDNYLWKKTPNNGIQWYHQNLQNYDIHYHGLSAKCFGGYQMKFFDYLTGDLFMGLGMRYSIEDAPEGNFLRFNENVNDYGYRGLMLVGGLRMGIMW
jgi:hypothetical protein